MFNTTKDDLMQMVRSQNFSGNIAEEFYGDPLIETEFLIELFTCRQEMSKAGYSTRGQGFEVDPL